MPIDRDATLKRAEQLLRQGKLDAAIAEYAALTSAYPGDWSSLNALGDLYVRIGNTDRGVAQFLRAGDQLAREGADARAAAVYRKVLRLQPSEPRAARALEQLAGKQEGGRRPGRGGAALPAHDPDARMVAAREAQDASDPGRACALLIEAADLYEAQGRPSDALAAVAEAASVDPANATYRIRMLQMLIAQGELGQARSAARAGVELVMVADALERSGRVAEAADTLEEAATLDAANVALRHRALRQMVNAGALDRARQLARTADDFAVITAALHGDEREAVGLEEPPPRPVSAAPPAAADLIVDLDAAPPPTTPDPAFARAERAADAALAAGDPAAAVAALQALLDDRPDHIPALLKLIEVCVDARRTGVMRAAQERLADAYLRAGQGAEARLIAEDLVLRAPWERAAVERLLRALVLCRDEDPERTIANLLCADSALRLEDA